MSLHAQDDPPLRLDQEARLRAVWTPPSGWFFRWTELARVTGSMVFNAPSAPRP